MSNIERDHWFHLTYTYPISCALTPKGLDADAALLLGAQHEQDLLVTTVMRRTSRRPEPPKQLEGDAAKSTHVHRTAPAICHHQTTGPKCQDSSHTSAVNHPPCSQVSLEYNNKLRKSASCIPLNNISRRLKLTGLSIHPSTPFCKYSSLRDSSSDAEMATMGVRKCKLDDSNVSFSLSFSLRRIRSVA